MIIVSDIQTQKHNPDILYYENDFFKNYESFLDGNNGDNYRFYLDRELSKKEVIKYLENSEDNCIYFNKPQVLSMLMTEKLLEKMIYAPFQWKDISYEEGYNLLNCVDFYFKNYPEYDNLKALANKPALKKSICKAKKESRPLTKEVEVIGVKHNQDTYQVIFQLDERYNQQKIKVVNQNNVEYQIEQKEQSDGNIIYIVNVSNQNKTVLKVNYLNSNLNFKKMSSLKYGRVKRHQLHLTKFNVVTKLKMLFKSK